MGIMTAAKGEHNIKSINEQFIDKKDQSSLNRLITEAKWNLQPIVNQGRDLLLCDSELNQDIEHKIIDDTVCKKHGSQTEMVCYNHSSTMGTVLNHDWVTSVRSVLSIGGTVGWLRRSAMHLFIHKVRNLKMPTKTILRLIDTR